MFINVLEIKKDIIELINLQSDEQNIRLSMVH